MGLTFRALVIALSIGWLAGASRDARAQPSWTDDYATPRHATPPRLARSAAPAALLPADPLCGSSLSGVVVLDRDVSCGASEVFLGSGATLDLGGFRYEGMIGAGGQGSTLRNGTIVGGPVDLRGCEDCLIEAVHVRDGLEFVVLPGPRNVIRASRFSGNGIAVDVYYEEPDDVTVVDCEFEGNDTGVNLAAGSRSLVSSSTFHGNAVGVNLWNEDGSFDAIDVNDDVISDNDFVENGRGAVVRVQHCDEPGCLDGNRFVGNVFSGNERAGLVLHPEPGEDTCTPPDDCDLSDLRIEDNRFEANGFGSGAVGGDGLDVSGPPEVMDGIVVARNVVVANADLGIEAPGVVDGGGNRARDNGNPLQCVGVVCELLVDIELKKGDAKQVFHARSHRLIEVVLLGSESFDVAFVDVRSLAFGPAGAAAEKVKRKLRDENRDGYADLVVRFRNHETGIAFGDREVCLRGETRDDVPFGGCAAISMQGACGYGFELALVLPPLLWMRRGVGAASRRVARSA